MRRIRIVPLVVASLVLAATIGLAACGDDGGGGGEKTLNLTIGDIVPLTGDLSDYGPSGRKAADLAVDQINAAVKEAGADHTVKVVHEDDQTDPQAAVQAARKVVDADNATCIAGGYSSTSSTIPIANSVTIREGVLEFSPASTADEISDLKDDGLINRTATADRFQGPTLAGSIEESLGGAQGKTINIAARNDAYGTGLADTFTKPWEEKGGQIGERVIYDPEQPSYNSEAQQIVSGNPDALVDHRLPGDLREGRPGAGAHGRLGPEEVVLHGRPCVHRAARGRRP